MLVETSTLEKLDPVVTSLSDSLYKAAKVNTDRTRVDEIVESDEGIGEVIGDINQRYLNPNNEESWKDLREEAVDHLRKVVSRREFES